MGFIRLGVREFGGATCAAHQRGRPGTAVREGWPALIPAFRDGVLARFGGDEVRIDRRFSEPEKRWLRAVIERFELPPGMRLTYLDQTVARGDRELYAWGIWARSEGGERVCVLLPRFRDNGRPYPDPQVLATAYVGVEGVPGRKPESWYEGPHSPVSGIGPPQWIDVYEHYADSGQRRLVHSASRAETIAAYKGRARPLAAELIAVPPPRTAGHECGRCRLLDRCSKVVSSPGLVGPVTSSTRGLRTWSATNGRYYRACPLQDRLYRVRLPGAGTGPAELVGRAVDGLLDDLHRRSRQCLDEDVPSAREAWWPYGRDLTEDDVARATAIARQHVPICPWRAGESVGEAGLRGDVRAYDPSADVLLCAQADLLYREDGGWVWRETKTTARIGPRSDPLTGWHALQIAVAVVLSSVAAPGGPVHRVELETLSPDGHHLTWIDPADPARLGRARAIVAEAIADWYENPVDVARPGDACARCQYRPLCPFAPQE